MIALVQRVAEASVKIGGDTVGAIGPGLLILLGVTVADGHDDVELAVKKCSNLRIFNDEEGVMNRSVTDVDGEVLVVSQFTLAASVKKGNRPSYIKAAGHELAVPLYEEFCRRMSEAIGKRVATGRFGADMKVELVNDGPVTIIVDTESIKTNKQ